MRGVREGRGGGRGKKDAFPKQLFHRSSEASTYTSFSLWSWRGGSVGQGLATLGCGVGGAGGEGCWLPAQQK